MQSKFKKRSTRKKLSMVAVVVVECKTLQAFMQTGLFGDIPLVSRTRASVVPAGRSLPPQLRSLYSQSTLEERHHDFQNRNALIATLIPSVVTVAGLTAAGDTPWKMAQCLLGTTLTWLTTKNACLTKRTRKLRQRY